MAIYSLNHRPIGKSTQASPYTAAAHIRYVTRASALGHIDGERIPVSPEGAAQFFQDAEDSDRKNARVCDKIMLALPRELSAEKRHALVRAFAENLTEGRAGWLAAFHDLGKDAHNPHCHLVIRDRDAASRKRVIGMSEAGSTQRIREMWELHANRALEAAAVEARIDRRTLKAQGLKRRATIHEGYRARRMQTGSRGRRSAAKIVRNGKGAKTRTRLVDYPAIDKGSRSEYNARILSARGKQNLWQELDGALQERELDLLRRLHKGLGGGYRPDQRDMGDDFDR